MGNQQAIDSMVHDGLWDPYSNSHMGSCAEECAKKYGYSRAQQDAYAIASFQRANAAQASGLLDSEISPVMTRDARGAETSIGRDEAPDRVNYSKIPTLRPAFGGAGTITAANASSISDGAAALVLTTSDTANARGLKPIGRLVSFGSHSQEPLWFTTAPVGAAQMALHGAGWTAADVDLWEVNEAFAVVPMAFMQELGLPHDRLNVRGGAISLGHPIGASGARILVTLLAALRERGLRRGVAAICIGGGEAIAACVELIA
jgi:acetyl-CoA C-acetyltransferase